MKRVIYTVATGKPKFAEMAMGLGRSLALIGDLTPRAVVTDIPGYDWKRYFDYVLPPLRGRSALDKLYALEHLDADQVLSIDGDCLAFRRMDAIFDYGSGRDFMIHGDWQSQGQWHGTDIAEVCKKFGVEKAPWFNGGMIYYERTPAYEKLLNRMMEIQADYRSTGFELFRGNASEEVCVLLAMLETGIGHVAPAELNFMNTAVGLKGKLKMDVMRAQCSFVSRSYHTRFFRPHIFHASRYSNFLIYWRELAKLKKLEKIEDAWEFGQLRPTMKLRRSIDRRLLKMAGKL